MMKDILSWNTVNKEMWTYRFEEKECSMIVYKISKLPDFTEHRFSYLCKEDDDRPAEVVKKQLQMLRQLHSLGTEWSFSLRLLKEETITLYFNHPISCIK